MQFAVQNVHNKTQVLALLTKAAKLTQSLALTLACATRCTRKFTVVLGLGVGIPIPKTPWGGKAYLNVVSRWKNLYISPNRHNPYVVYICFYLTHSPCPTHYPYLGMHSPVSGR